MDTTDIIIIMILRKKGSKMFENPVMTFTLHYYKFENYQFYKKDAKAMPLGLLCSILHGENSEEAIEKLLNQAKYVEDTNGQHIPILKLKDATIGGPHIKGNFPVKLQDIRQRSLREDDVIVCSYPKTGTHWICNIIHQIIQKVPLDEAPTYKLGLLDLWNPEQIESAPTPRVLASHRRPHQLPVDVYRMKKKIVLVCRNPKDTAVSHFFHVTELFCKMSWSNFVDYWMEGLIPLDDYFYFYNAWQDEMERNKDFDVLLVHYEDIQKNGLEEVRRIQKFLGYSHSDEHLLQILEKCSLKQLRDNAESGRAKNHLVKEGKAIIFRKGTVGDWKNHFTVAQSEKMDAVMKEKLRKDSMLSYSIKE